MRWGECPITYIRRQVENEHFNKCFAFAHFSVVYPEVVHFEENGEWKEIDHTLVEDEYDEVGNIILIAKVSGGKVSYAYDSLNQLIRQDNEFLGKTICYTYDLGGNMTSRKEYVLTSGSVAGLTPTKTDTFTYRSSGWKDQLTSYNGQNITYDGMGNPTSYRGMAMEWKKGRQLSKITKADGTVLNFAYDSEGNRVRKTAGGVTTQYYLSGGQIVGIKRGTDVMQFVYNPDGQPFMMRLNGTDYYYTYNVQGDSKLKN